MDQSHDAATTAEEEIVEATGPFWTERRTRDALGLEPADLRRAVEAGLVLGVSTSDGVLFFPIWQFMKTGGGVQVRPVIRSMLGCLAGHDPWAVALILNNAAEELDHRSPVDLAQNDRDATSRLIDFAQMVASEWSAGGWAPEHPGPDHHHATPRRRSADR